LPIADFRLPKSQIANRKSQIANPMSPPLDRLKELIRQTNVVSSSGRVTQMVGQVIEATCPSLPVGGLCSIEVNHHSIPAEVVGFRGQTTLLMPLADPTGLHTGARVKSVGRMFVARVGRRMLGRVVDGLGHPIDERGPLPVEAEYPVTNTPPRPMKRARIREPLPLGIRAIDGLLTCGKGQRIGIFSGSGVGKSTVLGMIARNTAAQVNVIALVGERGREVREFIERDLGEEGLTRSVVVVATGDESPLLRVKGALLAMTIAEYFRDCGRDVLFMMDSLTRLAMAQREIGLAVGEPPTSRGYTPSVFALIPKFLERAGTADKGTITALCAVLVEADELNEPISDHARATLDGHIVLDRQLASKGHYPSIQVNQSVSRVMPEVISSDHLAAAIRLREMLAVYAEAEDLVNIGAYRQGSNPRIDLALRYIERINAFLRQGVQEKVDFDETVKRLQGLFAEPEAQPVQAVRSERSTHPLGFSSALALPLVTR
jgi:flagellum-specific ATP synthase